MRWFLVSTIGIVGTLIVLACIVVLFVRHRIARANRVDPKVATAAPATWLADPRSPARLHRRLVRIGRAADGVADDHRRRGRLRRSTEQPPIVDAALALRHHAVRLDHALARTATLAPAARRGPLAELAAAVAELEAAASRLVALSAEVLAPPVLPTEATDAIDVAGQIERLAEAHRALLEIDAANGLAPGTPLPGHAAAPPPTVTAPPSGSRATG